MELPDSIQQKIFTPDALQKRVRFWRMLGDKIVFTNGCFDILHAGHVHLLTGSAAFGDRLIVALNADVSVKQLKGETRPVNDEQSRAVLLAAMQCVDAVILFTENTPENLIHFLQPDVLVKGGDWKKEEIAGSDFVEANGGVVKTIPYLKGFSTTEIITRSKK